MKTKPEKQEAENMDQSDHRLQAMLDFCEDYNRECEKFFIEEHRLRKQRPVRRDPKYIFTRPQRRHPGSTSSSGFEEDKCSTPVSNDSTDKTCSSSPSSSSSCSFNFSTPKINGKHDDNNVKTSTPVTSLKCSVIEGSLVEEEVRETPPKPSPTKEDIEPQIDLSDITRSLDRIQKQMQEIQRQRQSTVKLTSVSRQNDLTELISSVNPSVNQNQNQDDKRDMTFSSFKTSTTSSTPTNFKRKIPFFTQEDLRSIPTINCTPQVNNHSIPTSSAQARHHDHFEKNHIAVDISSIAMSRKNQNEEAASHAGCRRPSDPTDFKGLVSEMMLLGHNLSSFSKQEIELSCCTATGFLWKLSKSNKWSRKFFLFDKFHKVLFYYNSQDDFRKIKKAKGGVSFHDLVDVWIDRHKSIQEKKQNKSNLKNSIKNEKWVDSPIEVVDDSRVNHKTKEGSPFSRNSVWAASMRRLSNKVSKKSAVSPVSSPPPSSPTEFAFTISMSGEKHMTLATHSWHLMRLWIDVIFTGIESYN